MPNNIGVFHKPYLAASCLSDTENDASKYFFFINDEQNFSWAELLNFCARWA